MRHSVYRRTDMGQTWQTCRCEMKVQRPQSPCIFDRCRSEAPILPRHTPLLLKRIPERGVFPQWAQPAINICPRRCTRTAEACTGCTLFSWQSS